MTEGASTRLSFPGKPCPGRAITYSVCYHKPQGMLALHEWWCLVSYEISSEVKVTHTASRCKACASLSSKWTLLHIIAIICLWVTTEHINGKTHFQPSSEFEINSQISLSNVSAFPPNHFLQVHCWAVRWTSFGPCLYCPRLGTPVRAVLIQKGAAQGNENNQKTPKASATS